MRCVLREHLNPRGTRKSPLQQPHGAHPKLNGAPSGFWRGQPALVERSCCTRCACAPRYPPPPANTQRSHEPRAARRASPHSAPELTLLPFAWGWQGRGGRRAAAQQMAKQRPGTAGRPCSSDLPFLEETAPRGAALCQEPTVLLLQETALSEGKEIQFHL